MVAETIARYVEQKGVKQVYIAKCIGVSPQSVSAMLRGDRGLDIEEYAKLCDALDVPYDFFMKSRNNTIPPVDQKAS